MIWADSNFVIGATQNHGLRKWLIRELPAVSLISHVEILGYHRLSERERGTLEALLAQLARLPVGDATIGGAIALRQQRRMSLGDALIAATALEHHLALATANIEDFRWISGLALINP